MLEPVVVHVLCLLLASIQQQTFLVQAKPVRGGAFSRDAARMETGSCFDSIASKIFNKTLFLSHAKMTEASLSAQLTEIAGGNQYLQDGGLPPFCSRLQGPKHQRVKRSAVASSSMTGIFYTSSSELVSHDPTFGGTSSAPTGGFKVVGMCKPSAEAISNHRRQKPEKKLKYIVGLKVEGVGGVFLYSRSASSSYHPMSGSSSSSSSSSSPSDMPYVGQKQNEGARFRRATVSLVLPSWAYPSPQTGGTPSSSSVSSASPTSSSDSSPAFSPNTYTSSSVQYIYDNPPPEIAIDSEGSSSPNLGSSSASFSAIDSGSPDSVGSSSSSSSSGSPVQTDGTSSSSSVSSASPTSSSDSSPAFSPNSYSFSSVQYIYDTPSPEILSDSKSSSSPNLGSSSASFSAIDSGSPDSVGSSSSSSSSGSPIITSDPTYSNRLVAQDVDLEKLENCEGPYAVYPVYSTAPTENEDMELVIVSDGQPTDQNPSTTTQATTTKAVTKTLGQQVSQTAAPQTTTLTTARTTASSVLTTSTRPSTTSTTTWTTTVPPTTQRVLTTTKMMVTTPPTLTTTKGRLPETTTGAGMRPKPRSFQDMPEKEVWNDWFGVFDGFLRSKRQAEDHTLDTSGLFNDNRNGANAQLVEEAVCLLLNIGLLDGGHSGAVSILHKAANTKLGTNSAQICRSSSSESESTNDAILFQASCILDHVHLMCEGGQM